MVRRPGAALLWLPGWSVSWFSFGAVHLKSVAVATDSCSGCQCLAGAAAQLSHSLIRLGQAGAAAACGARAAPASRAAPPRSSPQSVEVRPGVLCFQASAAQLACLRRQCPGQGNGWCRKWSSCAPRHPACEHPARFPLAPLATAASAAASANASSVPQPDPQQLPLLIQVQAAKEHTSR